MKGDLSVGGEFHATFTSGLGRAGRVEVCDAPQRLRLLMEPGEEETVIEAVLVAEGNKTRLVIEERGLPLAVVAGHGAGWQAHVEDLAAYLAGTTAGRLAHPLDRTDPVLRQPSRRPDMTISLEPTDVEVERADLLVFLQAQRRSVLAIVDGLDEAGFNKPTVPSGWTPLGLIEHLAHAERFWFQQVLTGQAAPLPWLPHHDVAFVASREPNQVLAFYRNQCARSDTALAATTLDATPTGEVPADMADEIHNVRTIVLHMIEETARHAGHLDLARELIDGHTGLGPR